MHSAADHAARRAARLGGGFDTDPALPEGEDLSIGDAVVGQVENGALLQTTRAFRTTL